MGLADAEVPLRLGVVSYVLSEWGLRTGKYPYGWGSIGETGKYPYGWA
jgi:hypothetical protein